MKFQTLDDVNVENKTVFVRADLNCPVRDGKIEVSARLVAHAKTIFELSQKKAKVVILAHQGRKGRDDFISLNQHAKALETEIMKISNSIPISVKFIDDVCGERAQTAIKSLTPSQIILLDNVRFLDSEIEYAKTHKSELVDSLSSLCDLFCLDGFSVSHRSQASVIGFDKCLAFAGRVMQSELEALLKFSNPKRPALLILGGAKPSDSISIAKSWLDDKKVDNILCGGALANLLLYVKGLEIGQGSMIFLQKTKAMEHLSSAKELYSKYSDKLLIPTDAIVDVDGAKPVDTNKIPSSASILDIGPKTIEQFSLKIKNAGSIVLNGPMGVYEKEEYADGTQRILQTIANSSAYSILGGGHTLSALKKFNISHSKFGYVSLSGKALIEFLSGKKLPGVELLRVRE